MPDYRESTASAKSWRRACGATIYNPLPGQAAPRIVFDEVDVVAVAGRVIAAQQVFGSDPVAVEFDPAGEFPLVNPATGEATGQTMTHAQLHTALHSLYMAAAKARDDRAAAAAAQASPTIP